jgi:hypothetical protein
MGETGGWGRLWLGREGCRGSEVSLRRGEGRRGAVVGGEAYRREFSLVGGV